MRSSTPATSNLQRLFILRNVAMLGQAVTIAVVLLYLHIELPMGSLCSILLLELCFNVGTWWWITTLKTASPRLFFAQLMFDLAALTALLYCTGGASNPFTGLFLIPLTISATVLSAVYTWALACVAMLSYSLLVWRYVPLPMAHHDSAFNLHIMGMWVGFSVSAVLVAYFVVKMGATLRAQEQRLAATQAHTLRNEQLVALGTQAACTAHELGTPLNSMSVLVEELEAQLPDATEEVYENLDTLRVQLNRCKKQLSTLLSNANSAHASTGKAQPVAKFVRALVAQWLQRQVAVPLYSRIQTDHIQCLVVLDQQLTQAIHQVLDNAAGVSPAGVDLRVYQQAQDLVFSIADRGPGMSAATTALVGKQPFSHQRAGAGMGIGLYLSAAVIERFSGRMTLQPRPGGGMVARITLPLVDYRVVPA